MVPLTFFLPGFFVTMAQGIALPFGQAGAMAVNPQLAGTAAGIGVFTQNLCGAVFVQLYGFLADGTPAPLMMTTAVTAVLCLCAGATPFALVRARGVGGEKPLQDGLRGAGAISSKATVKPQNAPPSVVQEDKKPTTVQQFTTDKST